MWDINHYVYVYIHMEYMESHIFFIHSPIQGALRLLPCHGYCKYAAMKTGVQIPLQEISMSPGPNFMLTDLFVVRSPAHRQVVQAEARRAGKWTLLTREQKQLDPSPKKQSNREGRKPQEVLDALAPFLHCPQVHYMENTS